jgi:hypothetical protein
MSGAISKLRYLGLVAALLLVAGLLAACGDSNSATNNNDFTLPLYEGISNSELTALENSTDFKNKVTPTDKNFSDKTIRVFTTSATLADVKSFYQRELPKAGWTDRTTALLGADTLNTQGWVLGFEKPAGNNISHSRGVFMLGPNVNGTDNFLKSFRDSGTIPSGQNLLVVVDGVYNPNGVTPAPTTK